MAPACIASNSQRSRAGGISTGIGTDHDRSSARHKWTARLSAGTANLDRPQGALPRRPAQAQLDRRPAARREPRAARRAVEPRRPARARVDAGVARRRHGDLGQPLRHAPPRRVRSDVDAAHAPHRDRGGAAGVEPPICAYAAAAIRGTSPLSVVRCILRTWRASSNGVAQWSMQRLSHSTASPTFQRWRHWKRSSRE